MSDTPEDARRVLLIGGPGDGRTVSATKHDRRLRIRDPKSRSGAHYNWVYDVVDYDRVWASTDPNERWTAEYLTTDESLTIPPKYPGLELDPEDHA